MLRAVALFSIVLGLMGIVADSSVLLAQELLTVAERSGYTATSTSAEVATFLDGLEGRRASHRFLRYQPGKSGEGKSLELIVVSDPPLVLDPKDLVPHRAITRALRKSPKLRVLVMANIHGGEVEGKEVVQIILREFSDGRHSEILKQANIMFLPIYNVDGNDAINVKNRVSQNGPREGVGRRTNAANLDLNRDFVKVDSPECRTLMRIFRDADPQVFLDLHTTNGSKHAYHLTYATSLATNVDPTITSFMRNTYLPEVKRECEALHLLRTFDYGNYAPQMLKRGWFSFDHRARYATNYFGLRNRMSVLSEAYSYLSFEMRVMATRAFVLENLRTLARHAGEIDLLCRQADRRTKRGEVKSFGYASKMAAPREGEVLAAELETVNVEGLGKTYRVKPGIRRLKMPVRVYFESTKSVVMPSAWVIPAEYGAVRDNLLRQGIKVHRLEKAIICEVESFRPTKITTAKRKFQDHFEQKLVGTFVRSKQTLPAGSYVVPAKQALARLAAQLLEPQSEDGLATWNFFDGGLKTNPDLSAGESGFPVLRQVDAVPLALSKALGL